MKSTISTTIESMTYGHDISNQDLKTILETDVWDDLLFANADRVRRERYGTDVYIRGLIEISNYCKNNCYYCGIRCGNSKAIRYRLTEEDILECCKEGYSLGFRTFVLQGGEDIAFSDDKICHIVSSIKKHWPDCAVTLSLGEKAYASYQSYFDAGADRYLLRHETANEEHYHKLHPHTMSLTKRKECLYALKDIGYQVGSGFMVGSPFQTTEHIISDLRFLQKLQPDMIGIGPFITHADTPFCHHKNGDMQLTLRLIAILRLLFPHALLPSTTA
ncbi:MAG: [FeFe] hydrogenase H-cluster radical SAM maturase HydE, partial [Lachnospiraceae bacterium]